MLTEPARKARRLIVVSVDALFFEDLDALCGLPSCGELLSRAARVDRVRSIYPTLTHPVHATILTGRTAGATGITANSRFVSGGRNTPWFNRLSDIRCKTLFHTAKAAGLTTAASRWPLTACGNAAVDYLVPEVMGLDIEGVEDIRPVYAALGAGPIMETVVLPNFGMLDRNARPGYDAFATRCACEIIRRYRPHLLMMHPGMVDEARHYRGMYGELIDEALRRTDGWIGELIQATKEAGIFEETDFVVLSDHGQLAYDRAACPNVLLAEAGLVDVDANGEVVGFRAMGHSGGLSMQVFLNDPDDLALEKKVHVLLRDAVLAGDCGFERVFTRHEVRDQYGLYGDFSFVLETDGSTMLIDDWTGPYFHQGAGGAHGHLPEKGPQPTFFAAGPSFREGARLSNCNMVDIAPTLAAALGVHLDETEGCRLNELMRVR